MEKIVTVEFGNLFKVYPYANMRKRHVIRGRTGARSS